MNDNQAHVSTEELLLAIHGPIGAKMTMDEIMERICGNICDDKPQNTPKNDLNPCIPA
jgi:hypothetical protein